MVRERNRERERESDNDRYRARERESKGKGVKDYEREPVREKGRSTTRELQELLSGKARYRKSKEDRRELAILLKEPESMSIQ